MLIVLYMFLYLYITLQVVHKFRFGRNSNQGQLYTKPKTTKVKALLTDATVDTTNIFKKMRFRIVFTKYVTLTDQ